MKKLINKTKVVFRKYKEGDVIALFPEDKNKRNYKVGSYMQMGQHSDVDYDGVVDATKPASPRDYASLKRELEHLSPHPYKLEVKKKAKIRW